MVTIGVVKSCLLVKDRNDVVTHECVILVVVGEKHVSRKCYQGMKWLDVRAEFCVTVDIAKVEGDLKLFLCAVDGIHLIHNQLGTLGLRE